MDEDGRIELAVTIFHEITELKRVELSQRLLAQAGILLGTSLNYEVTTREHRPADGTESG